jgi:hypothetical protein
VVQSELVGDRADTSLFSVEEAENLCLRVLWDHGCASRRARRARAVVEGLGRAPCVAATTAAPRPATSSESRLELSSPSFPPETFSGATDALTGSGTSVTG